MNTKTIIERLNAIVSELRASRIDPQTALDRAVKLSYDRTYSTQVQNVLDDNEIQFANDIARNLRDNISNEVGTDNEICVAPDGSDLAYLDTHKNVKYARMNTVQDPIKPNEAVNVIKQVKTRTVATAKEA